MKLCRMLLATTLVLAGAGLVRAQDQLAPLQGRTEKLANEAGNAVVGIGFGRGGRRAAEMADLGGGAGFIIDEQGHVLTASTLVGTSGRVEIIFKGHHRGQAKVIGHDPRTHTALLQLEEPETVAQRMGLKKLPYLKLGKSADLKRGRVVATVGNAYSSLQTDGQAAFSLGVVSALGRVRDADNYKGFAIETDAAVNPGSYGGPLVDLDGKAVGIVIEPMSTKRWLGIAVPIDEVTQVLEDLKAGRTPAPPHLGLSVAGSAEASLKGVKIADVEADGPAAKAGVKAGDTLVTLDGAKVVEAYDIERELGLLSQGTPIELGLLRDGQTIKVTATLVASKAEEVTTREKPTAEAKTTAGKAYLGMTVEEREDGVYVKTVVEDGPAAKAKITVGAKLTRFNGKNVSSKKDIIDELSKLEPGDKVSVRVENSEGFAKTVWVIIGTKGGEPHAENPSDEKPKTKKRAFLGVRAAAGDEPGLKVDMVLEKSPAADAKIQVGDVILSLDGKKTDDYDTFTSILKDKAPGDKIKVRIARDGFEKDVTVTLGERPSDLDNQPNPHENPHEETPSTESKKPWVGFALEDRNGKAVVVDVAKDSPADAAGIKNGYAVVGIDGKEKLSIDDMDAIIKAKKIGDKLQVRIENEEGWAKNVTVTLAARPADK
ncbi:MAG TPA: PDZ domain-containing protein [Planctomycetota bacterium]|nr:PDZ domain-containing protein [Planctomycetota bacterium]